MPPFPRPSARHRELKVIAAILILAAAVACTERGPSRGRGTTGPAILIESAASARASVGRLVRFRGLAENGKLSAAVIGDFPIYCLDRDRWPKHLEGKQVEAEGLLEETNQFAAQEGPNGEISQGTAGADLVLRHSTVRAVDP